MMAGARISYNDIIDVEFETVCQRATPKVLLKSAPDSAPAPAADQLALLRAEFSDLQSGSHPDVLSPAFLCATLICALVVFWVSGGYTLLY